MQVRQPIPATELPSWLSRPVPSLRAVGRVVVQKVLDRSPVRMRKIDDDAIGRFSKTTCKTVVNDRCEISGACCQLRCAQYWSFALVAQTMVET